ncbi:DUF2274 domain-containing protein [Aquamicrobium lusatiense]|uniref:DUF2274 domain-containing protein n=1 Tax=Aquamicrobium lusatiense TaxID=89772 RepID=UPI002454BC74|nr:DUF2274 domain-containing protein [Aquamicrobium lusatiense]MDH4992425.1 DUF2274 domain-containing protein [Aquamicrobium lusatiense]
MTNLKLGPLPKAGMTRVTIALTDPLKEELDLYAAEHSRLYEPVETAALIPHMLESFLRSDRGWSRKAKAGKPQSGENMKAMAPRNADEPLPELHKFR